MKFTQASDGIIKIKDKYYVLTMERGDGYGNRPVLNVLDTSLNLLYRKEYLDTSVFNDVGFGLLNLNSGEILIYGLRQNKNDNTNVIALKTDTLLNLKWKKEYGIASKREIAYSATQLPNNNIVFGAHRYDDYQFSGIRFKEQTWIFEIDTSGNIKRQFLDPDVQSGPAKEISQTNDGGLVYCGNYQTNWNGNKGYTYKPSISRLDSGFSNKEWEIIWDDSIGGNQSFEKIVPNNNSYTALGTMFVEYPNDLNFIWGGSLVRFNKSGKVKWAKGFTSSDTNGNKNKHYFFDAFHDYAGNLVCAGQVEQYSGPTYGWIL